MRELNVMRAVGVCQKVHGGTTGNGSSRASFNLKVEWSAGGKDKKLFLKCKAWDSVADEAMERLSEGVVVGVEGPLEFSTWKDKEGNQKESLEVNVQRLWFTDADEDATAPKREERRPQAAKPTAASSDEDPDGLPF